MRRLNGWLTVFWVTMIPISIVTHWVNSVTYVSALWLWALVTGHWSTCQDGPWLEAKPTARPRRRHCPRAAACRYCGEPSSNTLGACRLFAGSF